MRWTGGRERGDDYRRANEYREVLVEELRWLEQAMNASLYTEEEQREALAELEITDEDLHAYGDAFDVWFGTSILETKIRGPRREEWDNNGCQCLFACSEDHECDEECGEDGVSDPSCREHYTTIEFVRTVGGPRGAFIYRTNAPRIVEVVASHGGPSLGHDIVAETVAMRMADMLDALLCLGRTTGGRTNA